MADNTIQMDVAQTQEGGDREYAFEYSQSLSGAGSTKDILIPDDIQNILVTAEGAGGATVVVYSTVDRVATVKSGTGVTWLTWSAGSISTATGTSFGPVTAIRMTQTGTGTSKLAVRAQ